MTTTQHAATCPTCGQPLGDAKLRRRVERAQVAAAETLRVKIRDELQSEVRAELEAKYAADTARAKARADQLQRQLDARSAHDRGVTDEHDTLAALRDAFPTDRIERHGRGGDLLHTVIENGHEVGQILYECKNVGAWQNKWIQKLKHDGRQRGTPYLMLVSRTLPAGSHGLAVREHVVVCEPRLATNIAAIVRQWVIAAFRADVTESDTQDDAERLYHYLASDAFRASFDEITDAVSALDQQLARERASHERSWKERDQHQQRARLAHTTIGANLEEHLLGGADRRNGTPVAQVIDLPSLPQAV